MSKEILITVLGGRAELSSDLPPGVNLRIRDYDVEGVDPERVMPDGDGELCIETFFSGGKECLTQRS